jgi:toxin ParE1/3/4
MSYTFHPGAEQEYLQTITYYEEISRGLGDSYLTEFETTMAYICNAPHQHKMILNGIRRLSMKRFPYNILYRIIDDEVQVLAIAHKRQRPQYWIERV